MIYLNLGRRVVGKTTLAKYLAAQQPAQLVIDTRFQWDRADALNDPDRHELIERLENDESIIVQPIDIQETADLCADVARELLVTNDDGARRLAIVIDDSSLIADLRAWGPVFRGCDRDRTTIILTTHRPQDVATTIRSVGDYWCIFRVTQEHDLDVIRQRCGDRVAQLVTTLEPYQFVSWNDGTAEYRVHLDGAFWKTPAPPAIARRGASKLWND